MKTYIGTKTVKAEPAVRIDGQVYLLSEAYPKSLNAEHGYKVIDENGYESFSPEEVFDKAYHRAETHQDRLVIEVDELMGRFRKLIKFTASDEFEKLDTADKAAIEAQLELMNDYGSILTYRITGQKSIIGGVHWMNFSVALKMLQMGYCLRRAGWSTPGLMVFRQIPAEITKEVIPKMQSLPPEAKKHILASNGHIDYASQCLIYDTATGEADSWTPSISDIFASDWELVHKV